MYNYIQNNHCHLLALKRLQESQLKPKQFNKIRNKKMKPAAPVLTQVGKIVKWQPVMGAINYSVSTMLSPSPTIIRLWRPVGDTGGLSSFDAEKILVAMASQPGMKGEIRVYAIAAGAIMSDPAELELTPLPVPTPTPLVLAAPAGFLQTGVALTWTAVPGAVSYTVNGQLVAGGTTVDSVPDTTEVSPKYDAEALLQKIAAHPTSQALISVCANGPGGEVGQTGQFQMTVPVTTPAPVTKNFLENLKGVWESFTGWLTKKPPTTGKISLLDRPIVKWGIVIIVVVLILGILAASSKRRSRGATVTIASAPSTASQILHLVDVSTSSPTIREWTEAEPDNICGLLQITDWGKHEVIIPPHKDYVMVTPQRMDMRVDVVSGLNFEYAYNVNTLQKPVWAGPETLAQMKNLGQQIENKAFRFKTGKWPLVLKFEITPKSS